MKNHFLLLCLFFVALTSVAQVAITPGKYRVKLVTNNLNMEYTVSNFIRVAEACSPTNYNCGAQIWEVRAVRGKPGLFQIQLVQNRKNISWNETPETIAMVSLQSPYPPAKIKLQCFTITANDKGSYQIQPAKDAGEAANEYYLAAQLEDVNRGIMIAKRGNGTNGTGNIAWRFEPLIAPPQPPQRSPGVVVTPPSDNKIEIDFKTGLDNLEPKGFQKNLQLTIAIKNRAPLVMDDVNKNQTWSNNSIRRVTVPLPADINVMDLESVTLLRTVVGSWNNVDAISADNWNLDKITATAIEKKDGRLVRTVLLNKSGTPLFRFIYENRGARNANEGLTTTFSFSPNGYGAPVTPPSASGDASVTAIFGTGGDDLRGGNDNVRVVILFKNTTRTLTFNNLNRGAKWDNFSEKMMSGTALPSIPNVKIADAKEVQVWHTGGGGMGADNWDLDKFKLTISINGESKILVDKVGTPLHRFTGDTRRKSFYITE